MYFPYYCEQFIHLPPVWNTHTHAKRETEIEKVKQGLTAVGPISLISSKLGQSFLDGYQLQFTWAASLLRHTVSPCLSPWLVTAATCSSGYTLLIGCYWERSCSNAGSNLKSHCWKPEDARFIWLLLFWWMVKRQTIQLEYSERSGSQNTNTTRVTWKANPGTPC